LTYLQTRINKTKKTKPMKIFIPTNDKNENLINKGYNIKPLIIEAYQFHFVSGVLENTQNLLSKNVKTGIAITKNGKAKEE